MIPRSQAPIQRPDACARPRGRRRPLLGWRPQQAEARVGEVKYGRKEVETTLKPTAELEAERRNGQPAVGLNPGDLEPIAEESGLDPDALRAAAAEPAEPNAVPAEAPPTPAPRAEQLHHERSFDDELPGAELARLVELTGTHLDLERRVPGGAHAASGEREPPGPRQEAPPDPERQSLRRRPGSRSRLRRRRREHARSRADPRSPRRHPRTDRRSADLEVDLRPHAARPRDAAARVIAAMADPARERLGERVADERVAGRVEGQPSRAEDETSRSNRQHLRSRPAQGFLGCGFPRGWCFLNERAARRSR